MKTILKNFISLFKEEEEKIKMINDYDYIIDIIDGKYNILEVSGNFLEIGSFFGIGTSKLAEYLKYSDKKIIAIDSFSLKMDDTIRNDGKPMKNIYKSYCNGECKQYDIYKDNISGHSNIITIKKNTKFVEKESMMTDNIKNAFIIIDGSKSSKIFRLDLMKAWEILNYNGVICIPDYYVRKDANYIFDCINLYVDEIIKNNKDAIGKIVKSDSNMIFIQKIEKPRGRPRIKEV